MPAELPEHLLEIVASVGVILATIVQITPVRLNPWSFIFKLFGKGFKCIGDKLTEDVRADIDVLTKKVDTISQTFSEHLEEVEIRQIDENRRMILTFNNQICRNVGHTEEEYNEILSVITAYERYCDEHPAYKNARAVNAIANIKKVHLERMQRHNFLKF